MSSRRRGPTPARTSEWGSWYEDPRSPLPTGERLFGNGLYTVHAEAADPELGLAGPVHLAIHDRRRTARHDWREFQRIKSELLGPEREAVELYPAESRVIDTSNEFHVWVLGVGDRWPFGFDGGRHVLDDPHGTATEEELAEYQERHELTDEQMRGIRRRLPKARQRPRGREEA